MRNKIRVINIVDLINPSSGVTNVIYTFQPELIKKIQYDFIYFKTSENDKILEGSNYLKLDLKKITFNNKEELDKLYKFIGNDKVIVHNHELLYSNLIIRKIAKTCKNVILVGHAHSSKLSNTQLKIIRNKILINNIEKMYDYKFGCSYEALHSWFGKKEHFSKENLIYNPISCNLIDKISNSINNNKMNSILKLGHVGRFSSEKNHKFLIRIATILKEKGIEFKMVLIGSGPTSKKIKKLIKNNKLTNHVQIIPYLDKESLFKEVKSFDFFLFPSLFEGLGSALVEAQFLGVKAISSSTVPRITDLGFVTYLDLILEEWVELIIEYKNDITKAPKSNYYNNGNKFCLEKSAEDLYNKYKNIIYL